MYTYRERDREREREIYDTICYDIVERAVRLEGDLRLLVT